MGSDCISSWSLLIFLLFIFVCDICSDIKHFRMQHKLDTKRHISVCNIGSDISYFRMYRKFGQNTFHIRV